MLKSCCITGHRDIPASHVDYVKDKLRKQIILAIQDGYNHFISGFVGGADLYFIAIVVEMQKKYSNISLEAAIPYRGRLETKDKDFQSLIRQCDKISVLAETFHNNCYFIRNMYMTNRSERVIAVYDGRETGGTAFTILYARTIKRELHIVNIGKQ